MRIVGAWHTGFTVTDLDQSLKFYQDLLGLELVWRRICDAEYLGELVGYPGVVMHQALLAIPGTDHTIELNDYQNVDRVPIINPEHANPGTAHLCLLVEDLMALYEKMLEAGVEIVSEPVSPTEGPNVGNLVVYVIDPDRLRIELVQGVPAAGISSGHPGAVSEH